MIRVVVAEDSLVQRAHLTRALEADGDITVVGQATDAHETIDVVASHRPDVVTLDLQMPKGGGQHAIEQIMAYTPTPILVLSAIVAGRDSVAAVESLVAGALDVLPKPRVWTSDAEVELRERVRALRGVTVLRHPRGGRQATTTIPSRSTSGAAPIVAIAASTGGPAALATVLAGLKGLASPVLVVQHLHPDFVDGFVVWMARVSALPVELARDGAALRPGVVYVAPGGTHLKVGPGRKIVLDPEPETLHRPSADAMFHSLAQRSDDPAVGVVLTGMGDDGADGLLALRRRGCMTIAQDERSSALFGMPQAAIRRGAAGRVVPLEQIAAAITKSVTS